MTNEQHIENLKKLKSFHNGSYGASVNAAINALKHEQALGEAFNIALLYGKEKGMEAIDKALYQRGMDGIKEQEIKALEQDPYDFARWVAEEIFDDNWEYNKEAFAELACRKLAKLGIVRAKGDEWELVEPMESEE